MGFQPTSHMQSKERVIYFGVGASTLRGWVEYFCDPYWGVRNDNPWSREEVIYLLGIWGCACVWGGGVPFS